MSASSQVSELLYDLVIDPALLDLVLALAELTWDEIGTAVALLFAWDVMTKPLVALFWRKMRRPLSRALFRAAVVLRP